MIVLNIFTHFILSLKPHTFNFLPCSDKKSWIFSRVLKTQRIQKPQRGLCKFYYKHLSSIIEVISSDFLRQWTFKTWHTQTHARAHAAAGVTWQRRQQNAEQKRVRVRGSAPPTKTLIWEKGITDIWTTIRFHSSISSMCSLNL